MRRTGTLALGASLLSVLTPAAAQNATFNPAAAGNGTIDISRFAQSNLTTVDLEYTVYTGCGPSSNTTTVRQRVSYLVVQGGLALVDGDVIYGTRSQLLSRVARGNVSQPSRRDDLFAGAPVDLEERALSPLGSDLSPWPWAEIPYTFSNVDIPAGLTPAEIKERKDTFRLAVKTWKDRLPWLSMYEIDNQDYNPKATTPPTRLTIALVDGCVSWSPVGRAVTQEASVLAISCPSLWLYLHEIGHSEFPSKFPSCAYVCLSASCRTTANHTFPPRAQRSVSITSTSAPTGTSTSTWTASASRTKTASRPCARAGPARAGAASSRRARTRCSTTGRGPTTPTRSCTTRRTPSPRTFCNRR